MYIESKIVVEKTHSKTKIRSNSHQINGIVFCRPSLDCVSYYEKDNWRSYMKIYSINSNCMAIINMH